MTKLKNCIERHITQIMMMTLFGTRYKFTCLQEAIAQLDTLDLETPSGDFQRVEAVIDYNNGDSTASRFRTNCYLQTFYKL